MSINVAADSLPEAQAGVASDQLAELAIHVGFHTYPIFFNPNDSTGKGAMEKGPAFLRFPVQIRAEDAGMLEQLLNNAIAFVAFEVKKTDGQPGYYRLLTTTVQ